MLHSRLHTPIAALTAALFLTPCAAPAGDSVLLKPRADASGQTYVEFTTESAQTLDGPDGKPMQMQSRSVYGLLSQTQARGDGLEFSATLDRLVGFMSFTEAIKSAYDSDDPEAEDASPDHKAAFTPLLNMPLTVTLDAEGRATAVTGGEAMRSKLNALGPQNFVASSIAREDLSDRQIMTSFGELPLVLLPYREVKVGEAWQKTRRDLYPQVGKVIVVYDCTLERIDGDNAIVRYQGTVAKDPDEQPAKDQRLGKIEGRFKGSARFSAAQGRFVELQQEMQAKIEVPPWWLNDPAAPLMKIEGEFKNKYSTAPLAERLRAKDESAKRVAAARAAREAEEAAAMAGAVEPVTPENAPTKWLQWGGPSRDFRSDATGLANSWSKDGPPRLWERPLGDGFSSILCDGGTLYTMYSERDKQDAFKGDEVVVALDAATGKTIWEHRYAAPWPKDLQMEFGPGPHSTPLIVGDRLFAIGCTAQLVCLDRASGKLIWSRDLLGEFKAALNMRGYGSSPLAYKGNILLPVSAEKGYAVMAFAQSDGAVAWKGGEFEPGYASLLAIDAFETEQLVAFTGKSLAGLDPGSGATLWSIDHPTQFGANIATPIWDAADRHFFISSAYGMGSRGVKLEKTGGQISATQAWGNNKVKVQHATTVRVGDWVYASSGDFGPAFFVCLSAKTGEIGWRQRGIAKANVVYADGKLIVLDEEGAMFLVKADPTRYRLLAKATGLCKKTAWTAPTLYGRTLFVRDREKIMALDLGAQERAVTGARPR